MLSLIPQDPLLLGLNLRSALTVGIPLPDDEIWSVLKTVHMDETIRKRQGGLDMPLNFGENNFSAGEKQLLCAARALLKKAPILLCDEVASSLDQNSDEIINNIILKDDKRTVISIMHRLQYCSSFDRIIVLSEGKIVEDGSYDELLSQKGVFYEMINVQR
jgi:ABC-type multidrug transport system fused ATPase/permease subunit